MFLLKEQGKGVDLYIILKVRYLQNYKNSIWKKSYVFSLNSNPIFHLLLTKYKKIKQNLLLSLQIMKVTKFSFIFSLV